MKKDKIPKKMGRPSDYTEELSDVICGRIALGESLNSICKNDEEMPCMATVFSWMRLHEDFLNNYTRAREEQAETLADEIIEIADDGTGDLTMDKDGNERINHEVVARSRLRVEARKWVASKLKPKKFGEKITNEIKNADGEEFKVNKSLSENELNSRIAELIVQGGKAKTLKSPGRKEK